MATVEFFATYRRTPPPSSDFSLPLVRIRTGRVAAKVTLESGVIAVELAAGGGRASTLEGEGVGVMVNSDQKSANS